MPLSLPYFITPFICVIAVHVSTWLPVTVHFLYANSQILCNNAKYQRPLLFIAMYEEIHQSNEMTCRLKPYQIIFVRITRHTHMLHAYYCGSEELNIIGSQNYHLNDNLPALCHDGKWQRRSPRRQNCYLYTPLKQHKRIFNGT